MNAPHGSNGVATVDAPLPEGPSCGTRFPELFNALAEEFHPRWVKEKPGSGGRKLRYVTARTVFNRLDSVLGPENWWSRLTMLSDNSFLCELTIRLPDGSTLTKCDVGGMAGMTDPGDDDKSGASDALKRAAVQLGIGRFLYGDGCPTYRIDGPPVAPEPPPPEASYQGDPPPRTYRPPARGEGTPAQVRDYTAWSIGHVKKVNDAWHARHPGEGLKDLLRPAQLMGHLYLACVEGAGRGDGITYTHRERHVANAFAADRERVVAEAQEYVRSLADDAEAEREGRTAEEGSQDLPDEPGMHG